MPLGSLEVPIATPEDICIMKVIAATDRVKPKYDEQDIRQILSSHPELDVGRVRLYLPQFASALERPEIVDLFERLWRETRSSPHRNPTSGSDPNPSKS